MQYMPPTQPVDLTAHLIIPIGEAVPTVELEDENGNKIVCNAADVDKVQAAIDGAKAAKAE